MLCPLLLIAALIPPVAAAQESGGALKPAYHAGETSRVIHPQKLRNWRGAKTQALFTRIWYPVDPRVPETLPRSGSLRQAVFEGHPTAVDAPLSPDSSQYPVLLVSHGFGGSAAGLAWLGTQLAAHGYIAAAPDHPGNNSRDKTLAGASLWWERAADLSDVLNALLADPQFSKHIDPARIGAIGFSMGGYTVLELAGARTNREAFLRFCNSKEAGDTCNPPEQPGVLDRQKEAERDPSIQSSLAHAGDSYRDPRVHAVFAIAPGLGEAFTKEDLKDIAIPVEILAGAADPIVPITQNAERFASLLPSIHLKILPGGVGHYTFVDTCTPLGKNVLTQICNDAPGVDRDSVHAEAVSEAVGFFQSNLRR